MMADVGFMICRLLYPERLCEEERRSNLVILLRNGRLLRMLAMTFKEGFLRNGRLLRSLAMTFKEGWLSS